MNTTTATRSWTTVRGRVLLRSLILSVVLFAIAAPLGDDKHGIGAHHHVVAVIGQIVFAIFLVSVVALIALTLVFVAQTVLSRRHA